MLPGCRGCNLVTQARSWIHIQALSAGEAVMLCKGTFSLPVMSCRLVSASSGMLHSVVNHCPSPPLHPGASLRLKAQRARISALTWSSEPGAQGEVPLRWITPTKNVLPFQTCSYAPCSQCLSFVCSFNFLPVAERHGAK